MRRYHALKALFALVILSSLARSSGPTFDLDGPPIEIRVNRGGESLPIGEVPNLLPGDRVWLHPDLPQGQSVHYLLIAAFLRGPTNPPPESWFTKAETWSKDVREEGITVTVPACAEQALIFLAPATGGDFSTLRNAVRGRPGAFVRAVQELNQASLDRLRLEKYLSSIEEASENDPGALHERSTMLARSLNLKLNQACFDKPSPQQLPCLLQQDPADLVLNDGHSQSLVAALTTGPSADLIGAVTSTPVAGNGYYSIYLGVIFDLAHLMDNLHTAQYQYLAALGLPDKDRLNLKLNTPPSFHNPKSVLVIALPAIQRAKLPPLRAVDPNRVYCLEQRQLVLPAHGAPLVFATNFAHDFRLHLQGKTGKSVDLPAFPDAERGGFVIDTEMLKPANLDMVLEGTLHGYWGFDPYTGPTFHLRNAHPVKWTIPSQEQKALVVGRVDTLHLESEEACCTEKVALKDSQGKEFNAVWKLLKPNQLEVQFPLQEAAPGPAILLLRQAGLDTPDTVPVVAYAEAARLDRFAIHAGDHEGVLEGARLDEVASLDLAGLHFTPGELRHSGDNDELAMSAEESSAGGLQPGAKLMAHVPLRDGRTLELPVTVQAPRPRVTLIAKSVQADSEAAAIHLGSPDELPLGAQLTFVFRSDLPEAFPKTEKIEVASADESAVLSIAKGTLTLQDWQTVVAVLDPLKSLGPSAFGPLRFRPVAPDGTPGDWQPLATLVRVPTLKEVRCPSDPSAACKLSGTNLFLLDSVAADPDFVHFVSVPRGFVDTALDIPRPSGKVLYFRLRDDPSAVNSVTLPLPAELKQEAGSSN